MRSHGIKIDNNKLLQIRQGPFWRIGVKMGEFGVVGYRLQTLRRRRDIICLYQMVFLSKTVYRQYIAKTNSGEWLSMEI